VWDAAAESGDLAVTVGLSKISTGSDAYIGKYLTVWRRQPDGSVRFILDSGNDRPK
jgi:ketosteroid isomerase-like protein